jgi:uncharacterized membrane protein HdeD (DUF308 family)
MTTNVPITGFSETWVSPLLRRWWVVVGLGLLLTIIGILLLANPFDAVTTLAILVAVGLLFASADELAQAERHDVRWPSYVLAAIWFVTGLLSLMWPDVTLWALAIVVGVGCIAGGLAEVVFVARFRRELPRWGVWLLDGLLSIVIGVMALVWPAATVLVLAIILGIRILLRGLATIMFGLGLRRVGRMTSPHVPT